MHALAPRLAAVVAGVLPATPTLAALLGDPTAALVLPLVASGILAALGWLVARAVASNDRALIELRVEVKALIARTEKAELEATALRVHIREALSERLQTIEGTARVAQERADGVAGASRCERNRAV